MQRHPGNHAPEACPFMGVLLCILVLKCSGYNEILEPDSMRGYGYGSVQPRKLKVMIRAIAIPILCF
jgi:hypothetical protein